MRRSILTLGLMMSLVVAVWAAAPPTPAARNFTTLQLLWLNNVPAQLRAHVQAGEFAEASKLARQHAELREQAQGDTYWETRDARREATDLEKLLKAPQKDRIDFANAARLREQGLTFAKAGRYRDAEVALRDSLQIREKILGKDHPDVALECTNVAYCLNQQAKYSDGLRFSQRALAINKATLGEDHPLTANTNNTIGGLLQSQGKSAEALPYLRKALEARLRFLGEQAPQIAGSYSNIAYCLQDLGKLDEALSLYEKALKISRAVNGESHSSTALCYNNVASCLRSLGKSDDAQPLFEKALQIYRQVNGENHPDTSSAYSNLANCLLDQKQPALAYPLADKALRLNRVLLGEDDPNTAVTYQAVAFCLRTQGHLARARPLYEKALQIRRKILSEAHPDTAASYHNLASCLLLMGALTEAQTHFEKGLHLRRAIRGAEHSEVAASYEGLANCLLYQGKSDQALPYYEKSLELKVKLLGEAHRSSVSAANQVARCTMSLGRSREALPIFEKALIAARKAMGERHPDTAIIANNTAGCLVALGQPERALPLAREGLAIKREALGDDDPATARSRAIVAEVLWALGRHNEAVRLWQQSLVSQETMRYHAAESGFDRAVVEARGMTPRAVLAMGLARLGQPVNAFRHAEAGMARGLLDDLTANPAESAELSELQAHLDQLAETLTAFAGRMNLSVKERLRREETQREYNSARAKLHRLSAAHSARQVVSPEAIQAALADEDALVFWVEVPSLEERWGCVVRSKGKPHWERIMGSGNGGAWQATDHELADSVYKSLVDPSSSTKMREGLLERFTQQQFGPLQAHMKASDGLPAAKRLFVVPTGPMASIPAELLAAGRSVSYVPSGSVLSRLLSKRRAVDGSSLLIVGDPAFDPAPPPAPPTAGLLILGVLPGSSAEIAGIRAGDVLVSLGMQRTTSPKELTEALKQVPAKATVWRDGEERTVLVSKAPLGVSYDLREVKVALQEWRKENPVFRSAKGYKRLPGTRAEAEAIAGLIKGSTKLLGSDASEQRLDAMREKGLLKKFRLLHFATHGEPDEHTAGRTALILAQDKLPDPADQARLGKKVYDGRLTVATIRAEPRAGGWELDADLVVLSACQTGLGQATGEGMLGFAHALLQKGARSVVLARWKVDDTATSLLMVRFYENLLGARKGAKPMGRVAALDEAKRWLRTLSRKEAERQATQHVAGVLRGSEGNQTLPSGTKSVTLTGEQPFAHPFYWAAFTLIGVPD